MHRRPGPLSALPSRPARAILGTMRRCLVLAVALGAGALGAAAAPGDPPPGAGGAVVVQARFEASIPERFGADADGNGLIDLPNSPSYARPGYGEADTVASEPRFTLRLDAGDSRARRGGAPLPIISYAWEVGRPGEQMIRRRGPAPRLELAVPEGVYRVTLDVEARLPWGTARARSAREITVQDLLVVAMGDSYASGEGNPERGRGPAGAPAQWADAPGDPGAAAAHAAAHRSTAGWPALVALELEQADPSTSVTFVSVASTGARVDSGVMLPQAGTDVPSQIDQIAALVGDRPIDLLLLSVGGNDIGFARAARGLVDADPWADPICYRTDLDNVWQATLDGDWNRGSALRPAFPRVVGCRPTREGTATRLPGLDGLPDALDRLAAALQERLEVRRVYLLGYPDPTGGPHEPLCREILGDVTPPFGFHEIDREEQAQALERIVLPLNRSLREAAARHGWVFVDGAVEAFGAGHGYCAARPRYPVPGGEGAGAGFFGTVWGAAVNWYRHPTHPDAAAALAAPGVSWYRTAAQAVTLQGPALAWEATGTLHPNELGQLALARLVLAAIAGD